MIVLSAMCLVLAWAWLLVRDVIVSVSLAQSL
jgi:hypothetical protein